MKTLRLLSLLFSFSLIFQLATAGAGEEASARVAQGQKLFQESNFAAALTEFQEADKLTPDQPPVYSWMAACLSALKRYPEAKEKAEKALSLLRSRPGLLLSNSGALDIGYFSLLAEVKARLHDFEGAVATINDYPLPEGWSPNRKQEMEKIDAAKSSLQGKVLSVGFECLGSRDVVCARKALEQADLLRPTTPEALMSLTKEALAQADRAPSTTDEEKSQKLGLYRMAADLVGRLPEADAAKPEAQRLLARALSGTKSPEDYQKAVKILTSLWDRSAGQEKPDASILLDLAAVYSNGEEWDLTVKTASEFIQRSPNSPGGPGYCRRSFANYRLGQYQKALDDGPKCTNPDGTPRQLKFLDVSRQELDRQKASAAKAVAAVQDEIKINCSQLKTNANWVKMNPDASLSDLLSVIREFDAGKAKCKDSLGGLDTPELCQAAVKEASNPLNLSLKSDAELNELYNVTRKFLALCGKHLNEAQKTAVEKASRSISEKIVQPQ